MEKLVISARQDFTATLSREKTAVTVYAKNAEWNTATVTQDNASVART